MNEEEDLLAELLYRDEFVHNDEEDDKLEYKDEECYKYEFLPKYNSLHEYECLPNELYSESKPAPKPVPKSMAASAYGCVRVHVVFSCVCVLVFVRIQRRQ